VKPLAEHGPFWLRRPSLAALQEIRAAQGALSTTYRELGATQGDTPPPGYHWIRESAELGQGEDVFRRACTGLRQWAPQRHAKMTVVSPDSLAEGETVVLALRSGPLWTSVAGRIVYVIDQPDRYGFAYGTLPHHPETGEEAFVVERDWGVVVDKKEDKLGQRASNTATMPGSRSGAAIAPMRRNRSASASRNPPSASRVKTALALSRRPASALAKASIALTSTLRFCSAARSSPGIMPARRPRSPISTPTQSLSQRRAAPSFRKTPQHLRDRQFAVHRK